MRGKRTEDQESANRDTQRLKGVLDHCLLAMIAKRPRYGFELIQNLDEAGLLVIGEGSIYPLLSKMQNEGLVEAFVVTAEETGRKRKYYRILEKGEETLQELNRSWADFGSRVNTILGVDFEPARGTEADVQEVQEVQENDGKRADSKAV